jgi:hypothetical protein
MITLKACKHEIFKQERYGIFEFKCPTLIAMNILLRKHEGVGHNNYQFKKERKLISM